jgi:sn-glycerol 3-phosphate transport system substrate-binding protein
MRKLPLLFFAVLMVAVAPLSAQSEKITVRFWQIFSDGRFDWVNRVAEEFEAMYPNIDIEPRAFGSYEELIDQYTLAREQGNHPELAMIFEVGTQFARDTGWFKSIAEAVGGRTEILGQPTDLSDIIAPVASYYVLDGSFTSMPWASSTPILYANMDMLVELGLASSVDDVDALPETWQELEAACEVVLAAGKDGCITWPNHGWFFEQWVAQQNETLVNNDNGRKGRATEVKLTSDAAINVASWWQEMYNKGYYLYTGVQRDWNGTTQALAADRVPFILTSSAGVRGITDAATARGITVRTGRMPYDAEVGWTGNIIGGGTIWLSDGLAPEVEDAALAFLFYMVNTENAASWHQASGYLVIRESSLALLEEQGWFEANPNFRVAGEQINNSQVTPATSGALFGTFIPTRDLITQAMEDLMLVGGDPAAVLAEAEADANLLLAEYNLLHAE